ncbi:MAG: carbohydrate ABC transporter permease [Bacilli bacterium]|nr:carbohydrate ABC transporter permease [Bacilli bacterium]
MAYRNQKINPDRFHPSQIKFYIITGLMALFMLLPIVFIIVHAFKPISELLEYPPKFYVINPTLDNFKNLFNQTTQSSIPFSRYLFNSISVTLVGVAATMFITSLTAFALSKLRFKGKKLLFKVNEVAMMFVGSALVIPRYLVISSLGITNTFFAHIIPLLAMPVGLFLVKQFIDQIPDELIEAARLDGATDFQVFWRVIMPLIKPALSTVAILSFQGFWNNMETSSIFVSDEGHRTLAFFLSTLTTNASVSGQGMAAAASLIIFLPNLVFFIIVQSKVMDTMAHSGIK